MNYSLFEPDQKRLDADVFRFIKNSKFPSSSSMRARFPMDSARNLRELSSRESKQPHVSPPSRSNKVTSYIYRLAIHIKVNKNICFTLTHTMLRTSTRLPRWPEIRIVIVYSNPGIFQNEHEQLFGKFNTPLASDSNNIFS